MGVRLTGRFAFSFNSLFRQRLLQLTSSRSEARCYPRDRFATRTRDATRTGNSDLNCRYERPQHGYADSARRPCESSIEGITAAITSVTESRTSYEKKTFSILTILTCVNDLAPRGRPASLLDENQSPLTAVASLTALSSRKFFFGFGLAPRRISTARFSTGLNLANVIDVAFLMICSRLSRGWILSLRERCSLAARLTRIVAHSTGGLSGTFFHDFSLNR
jgi:hypothetical protein